MPVGKKSVVKGARSAKTVTAKTQAKETVAEQKVLSPKKPKKHVKVQTAEGWKRSIKEKTRTSKGKK